jgi:hypothetical protein
MKITGINKINSGIFLLGCLLYFSGCTLDNYGVADATLTGRIIDVDTNEPMPTQTPNGAIIRMYEYYKNDWSLQPYDIWVKQDGSFENKFVFSGDYRIVAQGPFTAMDAIEMNISGNKTLDIKVIPHLRLTVNATANGTGIDVSTQISKSANANKIMSVVFLCGKTPYVDRNIFVKSVVTNLSSISDQEIIAKTYSATLTGLTPGVTYYVRVGAFADNASAYYNYSKIIEIKVP